MVVGVDEIVEFVARPVVVVEFGVIVGLVVVGPVVVDEVDVIMGPTMISGTVSVVMVVIVIGVISVVEIVVVVGIDVVLFGDSVVVVLSTSRLTVPLVTELEPG